MAIIVKHLPGQHDQMTHGRRKRPKTRQQVIDEIAERYPPEWAYSQPGDLDWDREYWDNFDQEGPTLVYHGTSKELAKIIKKGGLKKGRTWMDRPPSVYFTVDEREAKQWRMGAIVEFSIPDEWDDDIITDAVAMRDFDWESSFRIERDIPPENIKSIKILLGFGESGLYEYGDIVESKELTGYAPVICHFTDEKPKRKIVITKGGPGSGHWGHAGRPGKIGGSLPTGGPGKDVFYPSIGTQTSITEALPAYPGRHERINEFLNQGLKRDEPFLYSGTMHAAWATASYEDKGKMKAEIVSELSQQTGVDEDTVNAILAQWANTSNDEDLRSLSLQAAAAEEFGVEMSEWQKYKYDEFDLNAIEEDRAKLENDMFDQLMDRRAETIAQGYDNPMTQSSVKEIRDLAGMYAENAIKNKYHSHSLPITSRNDERLVLRAMYDHTQAEFMKAGFDRDDTILIWRGIGKTDVGTHGTLANYQGNAIESWSAAYKVALDFRNIGGDVVSAHVPVRNILGTCKTGFGCWSEGEIVTFGTIPGMQVRVIDPGELFQSIQKQDYGDKAMIALPVTDPAVMELWREFGSSEDVLPLHVTLLYLGEVEGLDKKEIINILHKFTRQQAPIEGEYGSAAIFTDSGDGYPHVLLYDSPQLPFCFSTLSNLLLSHRPELIHGFTPHTTLAYHESPKELPVDVDIPYTFNAVMLKWGDEERIFPLLGEEIHKGGKGSGHFGHAGRPGKQGGSLPAGALPYVSSTNKDKVLSIQLAKECVAVSKECYKNSVMAMARVKGSKYVEGYFVIDFGDFQYPVEHGWLEKPGGIIIDITLPDDDGTYIPAYSWTFKEVMDKVGDGTTLPFSSYKDENWRKAAVQAWDMLGVTIEKGGPGSGHHGHAGRPGKVGGSAPGTGFKGKMANPDGKDTFEQYRDKDGNWTAERQSLHEDIMAKFFEDATPVDNPTSYVLGGGPAAGKSTLMKQGLEELPDNVILAAGDEIKGMLPEYDNGKNAPFIHEESSYLSKKIAYKAANGSYNVVMDGTGDNTIDNLTRKVNSMRPLGQKVIGIYVTVPIDIAVKRSLARAKATGRYMPESVLRYSHKMVAKIYPAIISTDLYDNVNLYDTSDVTPKLIASEVGESFTILDDEAYQRFLERGK